jgi:hypothetical protein
MFWPLMRFSFLDTTLGAPGVGIPLKDSSWYRRGRITMIDKSQPYNGNLSTARKLAADAIAEAYTAGYERSAADLARLRKAIEAHRRNVWGSGTVEHDEDRDLYKALQEDRNECIHAGTGARISDKET